MLQVIREAQRGEHPPRKALRRLRILLRELESHAPIDVEPLDELIWDLNEAYRNPPSYRPADLPDSPDFQRVAALATQTWLDCEAILTSMGIDECTCREELGEGPLSPLHFEVIFGPDAEDESMGSET